MKLLPAEINEIPRIWEILQGAIARRKKEGSTQWQNGYPNPETIREDIAEQQAFVLKIDNEILAYAAVIFGENPESSYDIIDGKWLTSGPYAVVHRVATSEEYLGKGLATKVFLLIEELTLERNIISIKVDTNYDNQAMLHILTKLGYTYCGEIFLSDGPRKAFEKVIGE